MSVILYSIYTEVYPVVIVGSQLLWRLQGGCILLSASFSFCALLSLEQEVDEVEQARQAFVVVCRVYLRGNHFFVSWRVDRGWVVLPVYYVRRVVCFYSKLADSS